MTGRTAHHERRESSRAPDAATRHEHPFGSYTIFEGTSEVQRLVIARAVSGIHIP